MIVSVQPHPEFGPNDHKEDAPHFFHYAVEENQIDMLGVKPNFKKAIVYIYRGDLFILEYRQKQHHPTP